MREAIDKLPLVSVIIPAYNCESFVGQAIDSVLAQSYRPVECIVVDDGSSDRTAQVVQGYGDRVGYIRQDNAERSAARNNGIAHASGDYLCFLDADDFIAPEKIADQLAYLEAHPDFDLVYSRVAYFREQAEGGCQSPRRPTPAGEVLRELAFSNFITIHTPLIRRRAIDRGGLFDPRFNRFEDWDFFLRLALTGTRFAFLDRINAYVRVHPANTIGDRVRMFEAKLAVAQKIVERFARELAGGGIDPAQLVAFHQADYGRILILAGEVAKGRALIGQALRHPFPHRAKFALFTLAAALGGHRLLAMIQSGYDRYGKKQRWQRQEGRS